MFRIELNQPQTLLTVRYTGHVTADQTARCADEVGLILRNLKPGFRLLVDLAVLQSGGSLLRTAHSKDHGDVQSTGISDVVRIIPDPKQDIGLQIMSSFHYDGHVQIMTF